MQLVTALLLAVVRDPQALRRDPSGKFVITKAAVLKAQRGDQLKIDQTEDAFVLEAIAAADASKLAPSNLLLPSGL